MADNVAYTPGSGASIATDDISSVHYPRMKMGIGADGKYSELQPATVGVVTASTVDATITGTSGILFGVSCYSTELLARAVVKVMDSTSGSTGNVMTGFSLSTGQGAPRSEFRWFGPQGVKFNSGIRVVIPTTAVVTVSAYYIAPA